MLTDRHSYTYEQYCTVVGKNIIIEETAYHNGTKKLRCLNLYKCHDVGGCKNKYILERKKRTVENNPDK